MSHSHNSNPIIPICFFCIVNVFVIHRNEKDKHIYQHKYIQVYIRIHALMPILMDAKDYITSFRLILLNMYIEIFMYNKGRRRVDWSHVKIWKELELVTYSLEFQTFVFACKEDGLASFSLDWNPILVFLHSTYALSLSKKLA